MTMAGGMQLRGRQINIEASGAAGTDTEFGSPTEKSAGTKARGKKRRNPEILKHFTELLAEGKVDDMIISKPMAACNYCDEVLCAPSNQGTTHLWDHYYAYHDEKQEKSASIQKLKGANSSGAWKYDEDTSIRKYYLAIIMHDYPFNFCEHEYTNDFIRSLCPKFPVMGHKTARARIMDIFHDEKTQLFDYFASLSCRFSCTIDLWTSSQSKGYLCVTCQFIDDEWKIHKRIINFMHIKGSHTGGNLSVEFMQNMRSWNLEHRLSALTLDNAASDDVCVDTVISTLKNHGSLHCGGKFFHMRCAARIINLIARDALSTISTVTTNIRALVLIVKSSSLQEELFLKHATDLGIAERGLSIDVSTRWDSTYLMLANALHFRRVFQRLILLYPEKYGLHAPALKEWDNAASVCNCLDMFYDATKLLSGSYYPTANLFFSEFGEINLKIMEWQKSNDKFIVSMAKSMKEKFDNYWKMSNVALAVACFLDPRYKMKVVEFYYTEMSDNYGFDDLYEFKKVLRKLYDSYASMYASPKTIPMQQTQARTARASQCDTENEPKRKRLCSFLRYNAQIGQEQSDLEQYWNEPLLSWKEGDYFDILSWWKTHGAKYPILARVARDVLAIPASTIVSESASSAGGRAVNKYRSCLDPQSIEAFICIKDWIRASRKDQSGIPSILDDVEVEEDEGAPVDPGDNTVGRKLGFLFL